MSDSEQYALRWRGRQSGPFPVSEINRKLDNHEIGTGHEIFFQNEWITLERFFTATRQSAAAPARKAAETAPAPPAPPPPPPRAPAALGPARDRPNPLRIKVSVSPSAEAPPPAAGRPRHRLVFAMLAVFAGFAGAHNFYARQWLTGLLQLLLSVATWLMGFGIVASWLWAMVEAVVVRRDGEGTSMI
jgi:TM2 domain-containing membrane protein YozV